jgi:transcriptional regulator with XRE-family HTH domain
VLYDGTMTDFVTAIDAKRIAEGLSINAFARRVHLSPATISQILARRRAPGPKVVQAIITAYPDLSAEALIYLRENFDTRKWRR